jgi:hypothetical protein
VPEHIQILVLIITRSVQNFIRATLELVSLMTMQIAMINDKDPTFLNLLDTAKKSSNLVVGGGRSAYLQKFLPRG